MTDLITPDSYNLSAEGLHWSLTPGGWLSEELGIAGGESVLYLWPTLAEEDNMDSLYAARVRTKCSSAAFLQLIDSQ